MDVDTVWQWSMRLWFLIIAWEEADGHRLSGWERMENEGHLQGISGFPNLYSPLTLQGRWLVFPHGDSFPLSPKTPSTLQPPYVHKKTMPVAMEMAANTNGMGRMNLNQWLDWDLEEPLWGCVINPGGNSIARLIFNAKCRPNRGNWHLYGLG